MGTLHDHGHDHSHAGTGRALIVSLVLTLGFVVFEAVAGFRASSLALLSDAGPQFRRCVRAAARRLWILPAVASRQCDQDLRLSARRRSGRVRQRGLAGGLGRVSLLRKLRTPAKSAAGGGIDHDRGGGDRPGDELVHRMEARRPRARHEHPRGLDPHAGRRAELRRDHRGRGGDPLHRMADHRSDPVDPDRPDDRVVGLGNYSGIAERAARRPPKGMELEK